MIMYDAYIFNVTNMGSIYIIDMFIFRVADSELSNAYKTSMIVRNGHDQAVARAPFIPSSNIQL